MVRLPTFLRRDRKGGQELPTESGSTIVALRARAEAGDPEAMFALGQAFEQGSQVLQDFSEAVRWYEAAATNNHPSACAALGEIFLVGRGTAASSDPASDDRGRFSGTAHILKSLSVPIDFGKAAHWNHVAAEFGDPAAQTRLAAQYAYGRGVAQNWGEAERLFQLAAAKGDVIAQRGLGVLYAGEEAGNQNFSRAAHWLLEAADQGDVPANAALGFLTLQGKVPGGTDADAFRRLKTAAEGGHIDAMAALGYLYQQGRGTDSDLGGAETWYRRASIRGHIGATLSLGFLLADDLPVPDYVSAALAFREAADLGNAIGQYALGRLYLSGVGVPADPAKAEELLKLAADQESAPALEILAALKASSSDGQEISAAASLFDRAIQAGSREALYHRAHMALSGPGIAPSDASSGLDMLQEAADRGSAAACLQLGVLHAKGELLPQNYDEAARWYRAAAENGLSDGLVNLAFVRLRGLEQGEGEDGIDLLKLAAEQGNRTAMWALHNLYQEGLYVAADAIQALNWLIVAARHGSGAAAVKLAEQLDGDGENCPLSEQEIILCLKAAADLGEPAAQATYGRLLYEGRHVEQDLGEAFRRLNAAAQSGNAFAQAWMGDVLMQGEIVLKDEPLAYEWYRKAAENAHCGAALTLSRSIMAGNPNEPQRAELFQIWLRIAETGEPLAARMVGDYYLRGFGISQSDAEAEHWLRTAAEKGQLGALLLLGGMILSGKAAARSPDEVLSLFGQAAAQGSVEAEFSLGVCFHRGIGVAADIEKARLHFGRAAHGGHEPAKAALLELVA